jgi:TRAP-type C4-dicarboxylate transport system permease small subunit
MLMLNRVAAKYLHAAKVVSWICGFIAAAATVFIVLLTVSDVFMRYFFSRPIHGSFELTVYSLVIVVFMAIPWATMRGVHVRVDLITGRLKERKQAILYGISCLFAMFISFLIAWYTIPEAIYVYHLKEKSDMLDIPSYPFYFFIAIGFFILLFILVAVLIQYIDKAVNK